MNKEGTDRIITAGWIRGGKHQQDQIIHMEGIGKCFTAGHISMQTGCSYFWR